MKCPKCQFDNPDSSKFCSSCAEPLTGPGRDTPSPTLSMMTPAQGLRPGDLVANKYKIIGEIGRGGMGIVYKAEDTKLRRTVALKFLPAQWTADPEARERFVHEAQAASALDHPNICNVHEIEETEDGRMYIAMACYEGESLRDMLKRGPLPPEEALKIAIQAAEGMSAAHAKGIVHRDIKPANMLITAQGVVKVVDFGLAKLAGQVKLTREGTTLGTVAYMSPEQARGEEVDQRTDVWSLGIVLYEMLAGVLPFRAEHEQAVIHAIIHESPKPVRKLLPDIPDPFANVVFKALSKNRDARYASAEELLADLKRVKDGLAVAAPKRGLFAGKRKFAWTLGAVFIVIALVLLAPWKKSSSLPAEIYSIAALPSQVSGGAESKFLTDAIPSTLSTYLGQIEGLEIKAPPTSLEFEKVRGDLRKIADIYGVKTLVKTTVTAEAARYVLSVQLIEAKSLRQFWGKTYGGSDYLILLQQGADGIRQAIKPGSSREMAVLMKPGGSPAELAFRRGEYHSNRYNNLHQPEDFEKAEAAFQEVLDLNPGMAEAAASIATLSVFKIESGVSAQEAAPEIESWARRALQSDQRCSKAWAALAMLETHKPHGSRVKSVDMALKAAFFGPESGLAQNVLGIVFNLAGPFFLTLPTTIESVRLDPLYVYGYSGVSYALLYQGRHEEALAYVDQALGIEPEHPAGLLAKTHHLAYMGRLKESGDLIKSLEKMVLEARLPQAFVEQLSHFISLQSSGGKSADSLRESLKIIEAPDISIFDLAGWAGDTSAILARTGNPKPALRILKIGVDAGVVAYDWLMLGPDFANLKDEPEFKAISTKAKADFDQILLIINKARASKEFPPYLEKPLAELLDRLGMSKKAL